jgi:hypothetical protein
MAAVSASFLALPVASHGLSPTPDRAMATHHPADAGEQRDAGGKWGQDLFRVASGASPIFREGGQIRRVHKRSGRAQFSFGIRRSKWGALAEQR